MTAAFWLSAPATASARQSGLWIFRCRRRLPLARTGSRPIVTGCAEQYAKGTKALPPDVQAWVTARKRYHLSHTQVQMARELGVTPGKLGKIANHRQEPWKASELAEALRPAR